jgi:hypothetical protein
MSCTALACTRKDRPTRTAGSSPLCTSRYTVILDTRISAATSATVRNCVRACPASAGPPSRAALPAESRADGPFVAVIATQSCQARAMPAASPPPAPTRAYKRRIAGLMGLLVLVRDNQFKILELFRCNSQLLRAAFRGLHRRIDGRPKSAPFELTQGGRGGSARRSDRRPQLRR